MKFDSNTCLDGVKYDDGDIEKLGVSKDSWLGLLYPKNISSAFTIFCVYIIAAVYSIHCSETSLFNALGEKILRFLKIREKETLELIEKGVYEHLKKS